jgi:hypothetical protein
VHAYGTKHEVRLPVWTRQAQDRQTQGDYKESLGPQASGTENRIRSQEREQQIYCAKGRWPQHWFYA